MKENNWKDKYSSCRKLVHNNYQRFCDLLQTEPICPITEEFLGQMASIQVQTEKPMELKELLYAKYKIQVPVMPLNGKVYLRYSMNMYNTQADLDTLYAALEAILKTTDLIVT